jgi:predicted phage terminase large subunit-like protein
VPGLVVEAICDHLQAVEAGDITRLIINVPPGCMKSLICNVFFPTWAWGPCNRPATRFFSASYSAFLTERDNLRCLRIIQDPVYQEFWGDRFKMDKTGSTQISNNKTGWKLATSVGGVGTGERADVLLLDDLNNVKEAESKTVREATNMWLTEVIPSRLNNPEKSVIINIQQRTHELDATGTLLTFWAYYTHLMLPMRYDPDRHCTTDIGFSDWRTTPGELLWPQRFTAKATKDLERMSPYAVAGQLQQAPVPRGGGVIKNEWWQEWNTKESPPVEFCVASLDTAVKEREENDYYALTIWGVWRDPDTRTPKLLLLAGWKMRGTLHDVCVRVSDTCRKHGVHRLIIEDKANGWAAQEEIYKMTRDGKFGISMFNPRLYGDKMARLLSIQYLFSDGLVYAPVTQDEFGNWQWRAWADEIISEVCTFPKAQHDDLTDSVSMALRYLRDCGFALTKDEHNKDERDSLMHKSRPKSLYPV